MHLFPRSTAINEHFVHTPEFIRSPLTLIKFPSISDAKSKRHKHIGWLPRNSEKKKKKHNNPPKTKTKTMSKPFRVK